MNPTLRVLILHGDRRNLGGVVGFYSKVGPGLKARGVEVESFRVGRVQASPFHRFPGVRFFDLLVRVRCYIRTIRKFRPHVIHVNPSLDLKSILRESVYVYLASILKPRAAVLFHIHGWREKHAKAFGTGTVVGFLLRQLLRRSNQVVVLSPRFIPPLLRLLPGKEKYSSLFTAVDVSEFSTARTGDSTQITILSLSRLLPAKGLFELLEALPKIIADNPERQVRCILAGDGPAASSLRLRIRDLGLVDCVEMPGYVRGEEKAQCFERADIFVLPSYAEGCPVALLEAMASALPVVATPVGAIPDLVTDGRNGFIVPVRSPQHLRRAVTSLVSDKAARINMGGINRALASSTFDLDIVLHDLVALYSKCSRSRNHDAPTLYSPVFIVGLHRTGSTLLRNILDRSPNLAMATDEMHLLNPWGDDFRTRLRRISHGDRRPPVDALMNLIFSTRPVGSFWRDLPGTGINSDEVRRRLNATPRDLKSVSAILLDEYRSTRGKERVGAKYPVHVWYMKTLVSWFSDAVVIHLTRDPRGIVASKLSDDATRRRKEKSLFHRFVFHYLTISVFCLDYTLSAFATWKMRRVSNVHVVHYESLLSDSRLTLMRICHAASLPFDESMLATGGKRSSHTGRTTEGIDRSRGDAWRKKLFGFDRFLVSVLTFPARRYLSKH